MKTYKTHYRRNLPHYQPPGYTFFVTFRLIGSLPAKIVQRLKDERDDELEKIAEYTDRETRREKYRTLQSQYFGKFDKLIDGASYGPTWLKKDEVAQIVMNAIRYYDKKSYDLICYTIMSNHVHIIFTPVTRIFDSPKVYRTSDPPAHEADQPDTVDFWRNGVSPYIVTNILQNLKRFTARECNKLLNRSGAFWQHESYDHVVRNDKELMRIVEYVLNNPVKVGLCDKWEDWKFNYCNFELLG